MNEPGLFRQEALDSHRNKHYGGVLINTPVTYTVLTMGISLLVFFVFLFLLLGEFSEKFIVSGYLESTKGVARVYPRKNGVIAKKFIKQGDEVKKGDKLFLMDTSYNGLDKKNHQGVLVQLQKKKTSIEQQIVDIKRHVEALKPLLEKKYIPLAIYNEQHDKLVALELQKNSMDVEILNYKRGQSYFIRSPIDGIVSSVIYQEGQYPNVAKPMAKILPINAELMAELFVPVGQSGFLRHDNKIIIRYDAYPYTRFGAATATIDNIGQSVLTDEEEDKPIRIGQPYYKVSALLDTQFVMLYGKQKSIQHGMTVSAVIVGSRRKIWQWIFDPLYSFYGNMLV